MSLLLDALKKAEKAKQDKDAGSAAEHKEPETSLPTGEGDSPLELERTLPDGGMEFRELSIEPMEGEVPPLEYPEEPPAPPTWESKEEEDLDGGPTRRIDSGTLELTVEESQGLSLDLDEFAQKLTEATGKFGQVKSVAEVQGELEGELTGSQTMPSMKNVQQSLTDFYAEPGKERHELPTAEPEPEPEPEDLEDTAGAITQSSRRSAGNVFQAKKKPRKGSQPLFLVLAGVVLLGLGGGGFYVWYSMNMVPAPAPLYSKAPLPSARVDTPRPRTAAPAAPIMEEAATALTANVAESAPVSPVEEVEEYRLATTPQPVPGSAGVSPAFNGQGGQAPEVKGQGDERLQPVEEEPVIEEAPKEIVELVQATTAVEPPVVTPPEVRTKEPAPSIRIKRRQRKDALFRMVEDAYSDFRSGNYVQAESAYKLVLKKDPTRRDALLGLAATAVQGGRYPEAQDIYLQLLTLNPKDRVAAAALINMRGHMAPLQGESRLKLLLDAEPNSAYLHFILGNLLSAQTRWAEAQRSFFHAFSADSGNADYAFNLAVSLDHMGQYAAAADYYRKALELSGRRPANFVSVTVERRIKALEQDTGKAP